MAGLQSTKKLSRRQWIVCKLHVLVLLVLLLPFSLSILAFVLVVRRPSAKNKAVRVVSAPQLLHVAEPPINLTAPKLSYSWNATIAFDPQSLQNATIALPDWMRKYFDWHAEQLKDLNQDNYHNHLYLVLRCLETDATCGGLSDRLKPLPLLLWLAAQTKRIFFIYWSRPCLLEEFLLPHMLNWSLPDYLRDNRLVSGKGTRLYTKASPLVKGLLEQHSSVLMVTTRIQDQHGGSTIYNEQHGERAYRQVFRHLWNAMFVPSPAIQAAIDGELGQHQLVPGQYAAAHLRAYYGNHPMPARSIPSAAMNAIQCASELQPQGGPILFSTDSLQASNYIKAQHHVESIVTLTRQREPLHLDKASSVRPQDYYDVFVDLYLLANAQCISHGQGGFGRFGVLLSYNASCFFKYITQGRFIEC